MKKKQRMLQLWEERPLLCLLPNEETILRQKNLLGSRSHSRRSLSGGCIGKRGSPGVRNQAALLAKKAITPKPPDHTYIISSVGQYQRDEKSILEVIMRGKNNQDHRTTAMVDCGATENFIDKKYAEQVGIPLDKKKIPRTVLAVDGREVASGPVTHDITVELAINNHRETIKLHCITIGNLPIIVGLPWLKKHNPKINWREGKVRFDSDKCAKECLDTSPHAKTIPQEKAIDRYHLDLAQDTTFDDEENSKDEEEPEGILKEGALYPDHESDSIGDQDNPLEETDTENPPIHQ
jgi:predicted aspartyl protease